ncbi:MAG: DUF5916 domain-containing protein [Gemmatimonadota bacterium]
MAWSGLLAAGLLLGVADPTAAQAVDGDRPDSGRVTRSTTVTSARRALEPPRIDGLDTDAVWRDTEARSDFRQFNPAPDADPSLRTEFRVAYDDDNLYVFVRAFDAHPDSIMRALTRRDVRGPSDQITLYIDSYNDRRTGFSFHVNPDGVKRDYSIFNDGNEDVSWNGIWDAVPQVDSLGWTAEFRIPLSQLRFADADEHTFGFGIRRQIERYNESVSWPLYSQNVSGLVSQLGYLEGLENLGSVRRAELTPYALTRNVSRPLGGGGFERAQEISVGGDLKVGLTPNIILDATVNPDFGQVEADPAVLNLTAFEVFQSERRPFFVEGTGLYQFALNCYIVVDCQTNEGLFYSRRIGRSPSLASEYGDARTPTSTPIAAAVKLTGRTRGGLSFGVLDAFTQQVEGTQGRAVEPRTNHTVLRVQQDFRNGDAGIGWIGTAVHRGLDENTRAWMHESAWVSGLSFRNRFGDRNYEVAGSFAASHVAGSEEAITRTQRSSVHYYQQPGDDLALDSARTSLSGTALQLKVGKYGGGITRFETSLVRQSAGFEPNDLGFLRRADILDWSTWAALSFRSPTRLYRWAQLNANHWEHWSTSGLRLENALNVNGHMGLHNNWDVHAGATFGRLGETWCDRCTRGGPALRQSGGIFPWFGVNGDSRRMVVPGMWVNLDFADEGRTRRTSLSPYLNMNVSTRLRANLGVNVNHVDRDAQWYGNFTDGTGVTHHTFAHLDQRTVSMNVRLNYTATPDLTFEFYGEPFASSGTYSDVREVSATPGADDYDDRFRPYAPPADEALSFSFRQLRTNAVLRWEYSPGSTLFLVWAHGREAYLEDEPRQPWRRDFNGLFDLHPDNTFLVKVAYWLNR